MKKMLPWIAVAAAALVIVAAWLTYKPAVNLSNVVVLNPTPAPTATATPIRTPSAAEFLHQANDSLTDAEKTENDAATNIQNIQSTMDALKNVRATAYAVGTQAAYDRETQVSLVKTAAANLGTAAPTPHPTRTPTATP